MGAEEVVPSGETSVLLADELIPVPVAAMPVLLPPGAE